MQEVSGMKPEEFIRILAQAARLKITTRHCYDASLLYRGGPQGECRGSQLADRADGYAADRR